MVLWTVVGVLLFTESLVTEPESNRHVGDAGTDDGGEGEESYMKIWTAFM